MKRWVLFSIVLLLSIAAIYLLLPDRNRTALTSGKGFTSSGSKWGIQIESSDNEAHKLLIGDGFEYKYQQPNGRCGDQAQQGRTVEYYSDTGWRRGIVCLTIDDGTVRGIGWNYVLGAP
ncbi:hypothetical protein [Henriciella marina]|uniref:Uncharacterized protein n=1 Tax=Henriciella marina TaxID=453851 RepID=A0ABT4LUC6_9PROT|nr:hypothetical protein [Henriciella marina]MCZ4297967.1 hypothetical protein [Henriciella marina]